jgi:hypothetical protein
MTHCSVRLREAALLAIQEADRSVCTQYIKEWMNKHLIKAQ